MTESPYIIICKMLQNEWMKWEKKLVNNHKSKTDRRVRRKKKKNPMMYLITWEKKWVELKGEYKQWEEESTFRDEWKHFFIIIPCSLWSINSNKKKQEKKCHFIYHLDSTAHIGNNRERERENVQVAIKKSQKKL